MSMSAGQVAPVSRRVLAYVIDALIAGGLAVVLVVLVFVISASSGPRAFLGVYLIGMVIAMLLILAWQVVYTLMQAGSGSIGMRAQGLRLGRSSDGGPIGFWRALLRNIVFGAAASVVVGCFSPLFDGSGRFQGWHDRVADALMLDARFGTAWSAGPASEASQTTAMPTPPTAAMPAPTYGAPAVPAPPLAPAAPVLPAAPLMPAAPALPTPPVVPPAPAVPAAAGQQTASSFEGTGDLDETVMAPPSRIAPPAPPVGAAPPAPPARVAAQAPAADDSLISFVPGITVDTPPARVQSVPEPVPGPDTEDTRISIPGHRLIFTWDDGTRVTVSRRTVFGRNPAPEDGAVVVPVRDETLSLSKTHFEAASDVSGGWVMDRDSTNGMTIVREGVRIACPPGERVHVRLGDAIEIGDRVVTIGGYA